MRFCRHSYIYGVTKRVTEVTKRETFHFLSLPGDHGRTRDQGGRSSDQALHYIWRDKPGRLADKRCHFSLISHYQGRHVAAPPGRLRLPMQPLYIKERQKVEFSVGRRFCLDFFAVEAIA